MKAKSRIVRVQAALNEAEAEVQKLGRRVQFLVTPEGGVEVVRRTGRGEAEEPKEVIARLEGCDPLLWRAERPEGPITLGPPYPGQGARCCVSGEVLPAGAPVELYYRGRSVSVGEAQRVAPLLALVRGMVAATASVVAELGEAARRLGEIENGELRGVVADQLARELAGRLTRGFSGVPVEEDGAGLVALA